MTKLNTYSHAKTMHILYCHTHTHTHSHHVEFRYKSHNYGRYVVQEEAGYRRRRQGTGGGRVQEDEGLEAQRAADDLHSQRQERKMKICDGEKEAGL